MTETKKEVEEMKEFMTILMEVKISLADQNGKLDSLLDMKPKLESAHDIANSAERRSVENEKDIEKIHVKISKKASKEDIERMVEEKDNWKKTLPAWVAIVVSIIAIAMQFN